MEQGTAHTSAVADQPKQPITLSFSFQTEPHVMNLYHTYSTHGNSDLLMVTVFHMEV